MKQEKLNTRPSGIWGFRDQGNVFWMNHEKKDSWIPGKAKAN